MDKFTIDESEHFGLLSAIAGALAAWSKVEMKLALLFGIISTIPDRAKANAVFDAVVSFDARLAICDRLMPLQQFSELELEMWARMSAKLRKSYKKRHEVAHFTLGFDDIAKDGFNKPLIMPYFTWEKWLSRNAPTLDRSQVEERLQKFTEIEAAVQWFALLAIAIEKPTELHELEHEEPPLIPHIRALAVQILEERKKPPRS